MQPLLAPPILIGSLRSISRACFAEYAPEPNPTTKTKDVVWFRAQR